MLYLDLYFSKGKRTYIAYARRHGDITMDRAKQSTHEARHTAGRLLASMPRSALRMHVHVREDTTTHFALGSVMRGTSCWPELAAAVRIAAYGRISWRWGGRRGARNAHRSFPRAEERRQWLPAGASSAREGQLGAVHRLRGRKSGEGEHTDKR
jgi:hypothetical protein